MYLEYKDNNFKLIHAVNCTYIIKYILSMFLRSS